VNIGEKLMSVHVVPIGLDSPERFMEGFTKFSTSKVIFLMGMKQTDIELEAIKIKEEVKKGIGKHVIVEEYNANLFSFSDCIRELAKLITREKQKDEEKLVYINISSSTKVMTQAAYMAASLFSARIYYVPAEKYLSMELIPLLNNEDDNAIKEMIESLKSEKKYLSMGVKEAFEIPVLRTEPPDKNELAVLKVINKAENSKYGSLKSLVIDGLKLSYTGSNKNKYSKVVKKLEEHGFVSTSRSGINKGIKLTESGKVIAEISYILENKISS
jgi:predicted transcriptional regulator